MGNTAPRHSFKYNVEQDNSSVGSTESQPSPRCYRYNMTQGKSQGQHVTPSVTMEMTCDNLQHLCCSADGTVWVCRRPQILQLDRKGQTLLLLEVKIEICGLAAGSKDDLIFTDGKNKRLIYTRFDGDIITKKVMSTNDWFPIGICFAENGDIVVGLFLPSARGRVTRYSEDGDVISAVEHDNHGDQLYSFPAFVTENGNGDIVVSDHLRRAVIVVDRWGRYRFTYTADKLNRPDAVPFLPFGVCCDSLLNIIVADSCNDCLHLVSVNGEFLYILLNKSSGLYRPVALSMSKNEKLFVGDRNGIKIFKLDRQQVSTEDSKSSRSNSLSSLEINRVSGSGEKTQMSERVRVGNHPSGSLSLHRSSTEKGISTMADFGRKEQVAVNIQKSQSLRGNQSVPNLNAFIAKQKGEGGSVNKKITQTPQQVHAMTSQSTAVPTNNPNPLHSSSTTLNKAATLPLKTSMTNFNSGMPSPFTFRKTNALTNSSRTMEQSPLSITTSSALTCTTVPKTSISTLSTTTLQPSLSKDPKMTTVSSGATANMKIKESTSSPAVATQVSKSNTSSVSSTKETSGTSKKVPTSKTIPDKSSDKKSSSSPPDSNNESVTKPKAIQSSDRKEATGTPKSSPKKAKSAKSSKDSKEKDTKGMKSSSGTSNNEKGAKAKPISDSKTSQSPGMKEISAGTSNSSSKKTSSSSSSSKDSKEKKTGSQDTRKEPEVVSSSGRDNSQNHVQIHKKTEEIKQNPQSAASSRKPPSTKEISSETKEKTTTTVSLHSESNKTDVVRRNEHSDVCRSVKATEPLSSDTKETSNTVPSGKSRTRDSNIIESTRI